MLTLRVLALPEDSALEVLEGDHHHRHIVQTLSVQRVLQHRFYAKPALIVDVARLLRLLRLLGLSLQVAAVPRAFHTFLRSHFIENSVAPQDYKVVALSYLELLDVRISYYHIWVSASKLKLGLRVSKCPAHLTIRKDLQIAVLAEHGLDQ